MTPDLNKAKAYVTELAGGFIKQRLLASHQVSYYLTEKQYMKAVESLNKFWPDNYRVTDKSAAYFVTHLTADIEGRRIDVVMVEYYSSGELGRRAPSYYISLEDYNA